MKLTREQLDVIDYEIRRKWSVNHSCNFCGGTHFLLSESAYNMPEDGPPEPGKNPVFMSFAVMRCAHCSHTYLFNAVELGIFPESGEDPGPRSIVD